MNEEALMAKKSVVVDGVRYKVVEDLGWQGDRGHAVAVDRNGKERIAVSDGGPWEWNRPIVIIGESPSGSLNRIV